jgi:hypothetical protein
LHHALATRDAAALQPALDAAVAGHVWLTAEELQKSPHGLLALPLLGPLATARRLGLPFHLDTPYLPVALVEPR